MPWEFLAGYIATKVLDKAHDAAPRLFNEKMREALVRTGIAERYLSLTALELVQFYNKVEPISLAIAGRRYNLPMSMILNSSMSDPDGPRCSAKDVHYKVPSSLSAFINPVLKVLHKDKKSFLISSLSQPA